MSQPRLDARLDALTEAVGLLAPRLDPASTQRVERLKAHVGQRQGLGTDLTVAALAGSTGSGKSSLFNGITGYDLAETGVRRPTTSEPLACVWGADPAADLLDWLGVPSRRRLAHTSALDRGPEPLDGLVLVDLPDFDSMVRTHRTQVDRLIAQVDLLVWVTDPVKYADAMLHEDYLARLRYHGSVVLIVLNQIDRLTSADCAACQGDLHRLAERDGLAGVPLLGVSARTGEGLDQIESHLLEAVWYRQAAARRLAGDVAQVAASYRDALDPHADRTADPEALMVALEERLGVDEVARSAGVREHGKAVAALRWPLLPGGEAPERRPPESTVPASPDGVEAIAQGYLHKATEPLPTQWREQVVGRLQRPVRELADVLVRQARAAETTDVPPPDAWRRHRRRQWAVLALFVVGLGLAPWSWPVAVVAVLTAVVLGWSLSRSGRGLTEKWGISATQQVRHDLAATVRSRTQTSLVGPVEAELRRRDAALAHLDRAIG